MFAFIKKRQKGEKMGTILAEQIRGIVDNFCFQGRYEKYLPWGNGHINDTFLIIFKSEDNKNVRYILQHMNKSIFTKPVELMENIMNVTAYLKKMIVQNGGNPDRETLNVILAKDGRPYYIDSKGEYWRAYLFIEDAISLEKIENPQDFYESAVTFGNFQRLLADYPAETLHETIKGFHDTKERFEKFKRVVKEDVCGRAASVKEEIDFVLAREDVANYFGNLLANGELFLRVTHNDTKSNNVMLDEKTGKGICVIDLDTVMPGLALK